MRKLLSDSEATPVTPVACAPVPETPARWYRPGGSDDAVTEVMPRTQELFEALQRQRLQATVVINPGRRGVQEAIGRRGRSLSARLAAAPKPMLAAMLTAVGVLAGFVAGSLIQLGP